LANGTYLQNHLAALIIFFICNKCEIKLSNKNALKNITDQKST